MHGLSQPSCLNQPVNAKKHNVIKNDQWVIILFNRLQVSPKSGIGSSSRRNRFNTVRHNITKFVPI